MESFTRRRFSLYWLRMAGRWPDFLDKVFVVQPGWIHNRRHHGSCLSGPVIHWHRHRLLPPFVDSYPVASNIAAAGTSHRAEPQRAEKEGTSDGGAEGCGRISPSCRSAISMEFQTLGLGSSLACSSLAPATIKFNSCNNSEHAGHVFQVCALFRSASVFHFRQALLQLNAIQYDLSPSLLRF